MLNNTNLAEGAGLEPAHPFQDDGLAIRCITALPTFQVVKMAVAGRAQPRRGYVLDPRAVDSSCLHTCTNACIQVPRYLTLPAWRRPHG